MLQADLFTNLPQIGGLELVVLLDNEQRVLWERLEARVRKQMAEDTLAHALDVQLTKLALFKQKTLPVIKHFNDTNKLIVVSSVVTPVHHFASGHYLV